MRGITLGEIAVGAVTPGPEAAVPTERVEARFVVRIASRHIDLDHVPARDTGGAADIARINGPRDAVVGGMPAALLAVAVMAPGHDVTVIGQHGNGAIGTDDIARTA